MTLQLNQDKALPIFKQLVLEIQRQIETGQLMANESLPASRALAQQLSVSRSTVCRAYDELHALGYVESTQGGYTKVRKQVNVVSSEQNSMSFDWQASVTASMRKLDHRIQSSYHRYDQAAKEKAIDFVSLSANNHKLAVDEFRKCMNKVIRHSGSELLSYGDSKGYLPLRQFIARHLKQHGISVSAEEILLTNGSQHSIDLVLRLLLETGDKVLVESPTYSMILPLLASYGASVCGLPMLETGVDLARLKKSVKDNLASKFLYTMSNFQNPTGITSSQQHREALYQVCAQYKLPIIEDSFVDELKYFGKTAMPIKALDKLGLVIYLGSFSKVIFSGIRIGWIVANRQCIDLLTSLKVATGLKSNVLDQAAMAQFCQQGFYQQHIKRIHTIYRKRMKLALTLAKQTFTDEPFTFTTPSGGYLLFVSATCQSINEEKLIKAINEQGVLVSSGGNYFPSKSDYAHFRISIASTDLDEIRQGFLSIKIALAGDIR